MAGVYFWEFATSLDFEWQFISGKKKFHWPMIFYFLARYLILMCLIGILVALNTTTPVNCAALYGVVGFAGQASVGLPSLILAIRTMVIWRMDLRVVIPLSVLIVGHWVFILLGSVITGNWVDGQGCLFDVHYHYALIVTFVYSVCFDLLVLSLTAWKLLLNKQRRSQIVKLMFNDGLIYFVACFVVNVPAMVLMALNLNAIMGAIFNLPAATIATTMACRAVRRLHNFSTQGPEMFSSKSNSEQAVSSGNPRSHTPGGINPISIARTARRSSGVHVQMDTFTVADHDSERKYDAKYRDPEGMAY
ncbi:unnamed protein product [Somion occarium]